MNFFNMFGNGETSESGPGSSGNNDNPLQNTNSTGDDFSNFFDTGASNNDNSTITTNNNNDTEFMNGPSPAMNMGLNFESSGNNNQSTMASGSLSPQAILAKNSMVDNNSMNRMPMHSEQMRVQTSMGSATNNNTTNNSKNNNNMAPATPQQILMFSNQNNQNNQSIPLQTRQIVSNQGSPNMHAGSPLSMNEFVAPTNTNQNIGSNSNNINSTSNPNINNMNKPNSRTNSVFSDRATMFSNLQQKQQQQRFQLLQQQQQQSMNSPGNSNINNINNNVTNNVANQPKNNNSSVTNVNNPPNNNANTTTANNRQRYSQQQQHRSILQNLSPILQQRISTELSNKQYELFMKSLIENCKKRNMPLQSIPEIQNKKVNLFYLYLMVQRFGGSDQVSSNQLWLQIANKLQIPDANQLEMVYYNILLPYEKYMISPEGVKETQAKRIFLQQFLQELLKKLQAQQQQQQQQQQQHGSSASSPHMRNAQFNAMNFQQQLPTNNMSAASPLTLNHNQINQQQIPSSVASPNMNIINPQNSSLSLNNTLSPDTIRDIAPSTITSANTPTIVDVNTAKGAKKPKKPRKPRQKKKTKKELEQERQQKEEFEKQQKLMIETQRKQQQLILEKKIKQRYDREMAKLPKIYKRTLIRNYKPLQRKIDHVTGYDISYISQIGEKIDSNKPIFLYAPELGTINLHALSMSLQSNHLGEINTALNTLLVASADNVLKIPLNKYPELLNTICKLGISLMNDIHSKEDGQNFRSKQLSFTTNYCDNYPVEEYLKKRNTSYSTNDTLIDDIFRQYTKNNDNHADHKILVDSLTGCDIDQVDISDTIADIVQDYDEKSLITNKKSTSMKEYKSWTLLPKPLMSQAKSKHIDLEVPSYMEALKKIRDETDNPFTNVYTKCSEDSRILLVEQLSTISMILRNISFCDLNTNLMSRDHFMNRYITDMLWLIFNDSKKLVFNRKILNFKKDLIITLTNISHHWKITSYTACANFILLMLSFGIPKTDNEIGKDRLLYQEYSLKIGKYQIFGVDTLAKLLSITHPNKDYLRIVLLNKFDEDDVASNEDAMTAKLITDKYSNDGKRSLLNELVSFLFATIPFDQIARQPDIVEHISPVVAQTLTCLHHIVNLITVEDNNNNMILSWLKTSEYVGLKLKRLYEFYESLIMQNKDEYKLCRQISCDIVRLLCLLINKSAVDKEACAEIAKLPNLLPSEEDFFSILTNPETDNTFAKEIEQFYSVRNRIFNGI